MEYGRPEDDKSIITMTLRHLIQAVANHIQPNTSDNKYTHVSCFILPNSQFNILINPYENCFTHKTDGCATTVYCGDHQPQKPAWYAPHISHTFFRFYNPDYDKKWMLITSTLCILPSQIDTLTPLARQKMALYWMRLYDDTKRECSITKYTHGLIHTLYKLRPAWPITLEGTDQDEAAMPKYKASPYAEIIEDVVVNTKHWLQEATHENMDTREKSVQTVPKGEIVHIDMHSTIRNDNEPDDTGAPSSKRLRTQVTSYGTQLHGYGFTPPTAQVTTMNTHHPQFPPEPPTQVVMQQTPRLSVTPRRHTPPSFTTPPQQLQTDTTSPHANPLRMDNNTSTTPHTQPRNLLIHPSHTA